MLTIEEIINLATVQDAEEWQAETEKFMWAEDYIWNAPDRPEMPWEVEARGPAIKRLEDRLEFLLRIEWGEYRGPISYADYRAAVLSTCPR